MINNIFMKMNSENYGKFDKNLVQTQDSFETFDVSELRILPLNVVLQYLVKISSSISKKKCKESKNKHIFKPPT